MLAPSPDFMIVTEASKPSKIILHLAQFQKVPGPFQRSLTISWQPHTVTFDWASARLYVLQ